MAHAAEQEFCETASAPAADHDHSAPTWSATLAIGKRDYPRMVRLDDCIDYLTVALAAVQ